MKLFSSLPNIVGDIISSQLVAVRLESCTLQSSTAVLKTKLGKAVVMSLSYEMDKKSVEMNLLV